MVEDKPIYEEDEELIDLNQSEVPIKDRKMVSQSYDLSIGSLWDQINNKTIFLHPISERPYFQRRYVWPDKLASRLIESILLNVPIPPCYLSQNDNFELDVIDGQQRLFSIYRFIKNQFKMTGLEVLTELNGLQFYEIDGKLKRKIETHTLRCVLITNESHPEIKFDVFERLNTNTVPLNAQELRNCIYRGPFNNLLQDMVTYQPWLAILGKKFPNRRMRDEELVLRFFSFYLHGLKSYRTPLKKWLNDTAKKGRGYSEKRIKKLSDVWKDAIDVSLSWFKPNECFRREGVKPINRALFDLVAYAATKVDVNEAKGNRKEFRNRYRHLLKDEKFQDLISRGVDHTKRTKKRFEMWKNAFRDVIP